MPKADPIVPELPPDARAAPWPSPAGSIRITLTEDDPHYAAVLGQAAGASGDIRLERCFHSGEEMIAELHTAPPEVALVDLSLPGLSGSECIARLAPRFPAVSFIVLTGHRNDALLYQSLCAGAAGYVIKTTRLDDVLSAVREAAAGGSPMSPGIARRVVAHFQADSLAPELAAEPLSPRESAVLDALTRGLRYKEIAHEQQLSEHTVRTYLRRIYAKLAVTSRSEAVAKFLRN